MNSRKKRTRYLSCGTLARASLVLSAILAIGWRVVAQDLGKGEQKPTEVAAATIVPTAGGPAISESGSDSLFPEKEIYSREEVAAIRDILEKEKNAVKQDLSQEKEYMALIRAELEKDLNELSTIRKAIEGYMGERDKAEVQKIKKLAKYFENMDAEQAAPLLERVEQKLAISIFEVMDAKKAGAVLGLMKREVAEQITEAFPRLKIFSGKP